MTTLGPYLPCDLVVQYKGGGGGVFKKVGLENVGGEKLRAREREERTILEKKTVKAKESGGGGGREAALHPRPCPRLRPLPGVAALPQPPPLYGRRTS